MVSMSRTALKSRTSHLSFVATHCMSGPFAHTHGHNPPERPIGKHLEILTPWIYFGVLSVVFGPLGASWRFGLSQNLAYTKYQPKLPTTFSIYGASGVLDFNARILFMMLLVSMSMCCVSVSLCRCDKCIYLYIDISIYVYIYRYVLIFRSIA
jgi:hypothetical protein